MTQHIKDLLVAAYEKLKGLEYLSEDLAEDISPKSQRQMIWQAQQAEACDTDAVAGLAGREMLRRMLCEEHQITYTPDWPRSQFPFIAFWMDAVVEVGGGVVVVHEEMISRQTARRILALDERHGDDDAARALQILKDAGFDVATGTLVV